MADPAPTPDVVLRTCADAGPAPWFPSRYAGEMGINRDSLDAPLNELRLAGLLSIAGWEPGKGQCYIVTELGRSVLADPQALARLRGGIALMPAAERIEPQPPRSTAWERGEQIRAAFLSRQPAPVVYGLIVSQVLIFVAGIYFVLRQESPLNQYLASGLAGQPPRPPLASWFLILSRVEDGQWWRLLSSAFVHFGALHLLMNVYGLAVLGPIIERMYGSFRFFALYVLSALGGSIVVLLLSPENSATGGSSGALCGLIGGFAAFVLLNRKHLGQQLYDHSRAWLGNTIVLLVLFSLLPRVSWQAHLGGFLGGLVSGLLLTYHRFGTTEQRWAALLGLIVLPVAMLVPLFERGIMHWPMPERVAEIKIDRSPSILRSAGRSRASSLDFSSVKAYK